MEEVKTNGIKCPTNNSRYPNCHCNDCLGNVIQYMGFKKGEKVLFDNQLCEIDQFFPYAGRNGGKTCEVFITSGKSISQYSEKFTWTMPEKLTKVNQ